MQNICRRWWVVIAAGMMIMLVNLDATIVNLALPTMREYFHVSTSAMQWVISLYMLGAVSSFLLAGQLADRFGRKPVFLAGSMLFSVSSLIIGYCHHLPLLFAMRFVQGVGFAGTLALAIAMIRSVFPVHRHGFAVGLAITIAGLFQAVGPTLGGVVLTVSSWRMLFWMNVPLGVISMGLLALCYKESIEKHAHQHGFLKSLLDTSVFKVSTFNHITVMRWVFSITWSTLLFLVPIYLQDTLHKTPLFSGFLMLAMTAFIGIGSPITGKLIDKYGAERLMVLAMCLGVVGFFALVGSVYTGGMSLLIVGLALLGMAIALMLPSNIFVAMKALPEKLQGKGMGVYFTIAFVGASIGVWVASFFEAHLQTQAHAAVVVFTLDGLMSLCLLIYGSFMARRARVAEVGPLAAVEGMSVV